MAGLAGEFSAGASGGAIAERLDWPINAVQEHQVEL